MHYQSHSENYGEYFHINCSGFVQSGTVSGSGVLAGSTEEYIFTLTGSGPFSWNIDNSDSFASIRGNTYPATVSPFRGSISNGSDILLQFSINGL